MTTVVDGGDDDEEINPVTMLLLGDDDDALHKSEAVPTSVQHQSYHLTSVDSTIVIRQLPSQGLSFQLWPAATTFVNLLDCYKASNTDPLSTVITNVKSRSRLRILELGSGTGVVGIAASAVLGADVTVTDLPHVLPNLKFNVDANSVVLAPRGGQVRVGALSWGNKEEMEAIGREYDLIIGSDVVYHDNLYDPLLETLRYLFLDGEKVFLMAHLRRWKKESGFFKKAKKYFQVELIHEDGPSTASRTGVVVYRFARKDAVFR
ncbi:EEF1A lysine methyltransferase 3-like [Cynara cardunculus var. scolymus]|uniref:Nicotinamide N-methyltransferase-like protein n=1 Tax=Cynara cardunculus var. scolymus TaxID=59895 RepID=A0A103XKC5_CYNCS|nr:EEF1A lysine methyltransferase 3-like [Cynara cardunculus var. scolymus]KVH92371.1 Nicotinamide N-methyltransferase-like protein [Cynara cardunculus var. scolymus]